MSVYGVLYPFRLLCPFPLVPHSLFHLSLVLQRTLQFPSRYFFPPVSKIDWQPSVTPVEERGESESQGRAETSSPIMVIAPSRTIRVRATDNFTSIELPNVPAKPTFVSVSNSFFCPR
ncbi:hypothetical protein CAEBREN_32209 [Caenorhabditis brenneri]|uniref:Uncharacterized protein n=1 Tax=Caenorhabditis brenneri TaxID=135651 RepID=G0PD32_CAEBE|nr:hypothetical protein CAEBREN_32209 [Caenorhabditis brenneri]